jgi:hypothetical protein
MKQANQIFKLFLIQGDCSCERQKSTSLQRTFNKNVTTNVIFFNKIPLQQFRKKLGLLSKGAK